MPGIVPCMLGVEGFYYLQPWRQEAFKGLPGDQAGTYVLGCTVMDSSGRHNLLWEVVSKGLHFPKAPLCADCLDVPALSGLCQGSPPWALASEVLTPDSHTCNFEGARLVTSCDHGLYLAMAVVTNTYGEAAACSFKRRCLGLSLMKQALLGTEMGIIAQTKKPIDTLLSKFSLNTTLQTMGPLSKVFPKTAVLCINNSLLVQGTLTKSPPCAVTFTFHCGLQEEQ